MKRIILLLSIGVFCCSCTSSDSSTVEPAEENFYALRVDNSWIYKNYRYNSQTTEYDDTGVIDSISIVGTEDISGNVFYKFRRRTTGNEANITFCNPNGEHFELLRDSIGYLIDEQGAIKYSNNDYSERILSQQTWGTIYEKLDVETINISVEAGTFECLDTHRYARNSNNEITPALDHFYYADGIGLIYDTSSFVSTNYPSIIRRLDSYEVQ